MEALVMFALIDVIAIAAGVYYYIQDKKDSGTKKA
jgi:hypothetical protein